MALSMATLVHGNRPAFDQDRLDREAAARYLGVAFSTLENDVVTQRLGVPFYRIGRKPYYRRSDLDQWIESRRVAPAV